MMKIRIQIQLGKESVRALKILFERLGSSPLRFSQSRCLGRFGQCQIFRGGFGLCEEPFEVFVSGFHLPFGYDIGIQLSMQEGKRILQ